MVQINNSAVTPVTSASDPTLHTPADFVKVETNLVAGPLKNMSVVNNELVIGVKGVYKVDAYLSIKSNVTNNLAGFKYVINGTTFIQRTPVGFLTDINEPNAIAGSGITATLDIGDTISLYVAAEKACDLTIVDSNTVFTLLEPIA